MKPAASPVLRSTRLLDQVRECIRYKHYSLRTEQTYVQWIRFFVRWHGLRHPRDMGAAELRAFLGMLANERKVSVSTHNQAFIRTVQELLGHSDVSTTMIYTHVLKVAAGGTASPLDALV